VGTQSVSATPMPPVSEAASPAAPPAGVTSKVGRETLPYPGHFRSPSQDVTYSPRSKRRALRLAPYPNRGRRTDSGVRYPTRPAVQQMRVEYSEPLRTTEAPLWPESAGPARLRQEDAPAEAAPSLRPSAREIFPLRVAIPPELVAPEQAAAPAGRQSRAQPPVKRESTRQTAGWDGAHDPEKVEQRSPARFSVATGAEMRSSGSRPHNVQYPPPVERRSKGDASFDSPPTRRTSHTEPLFRDRPGAAAPAFEGSTAPQHAWPELPADPDAYEETGLMRAIERKTRLDREQSGATWNAPHF
jgi:hypothetical protein